MTQFLSLWRWQGLLAFIFILILLFFAMPSLIKMALESSLEASFEAKSNISKVELDYAASELRVLGLKVADKDAPMTNLFEWRSSKLAIDFFSALNGRFLVDDMSISGLKFGTARQVSGAIKTQQNTGQQQGQTESDNSTLERLKTFKALPSAEVLLAREPLKTQQLADEFISYADQQRQQWATLKQQLPDKAKLNQYQQRINQLKNLKIKNISDFNTAKTALKSIKRDLKQDKQQLNNAKQFVTSVSQSSTRQLQALKDAPAEDFKHLRSKYELSQGGALNVAGLLLGNEVENYGRKAMAIYNRIQPLLVSDEAASTTEQQPQVERLQGHFIHFSRQKPTLWIKHIGVDGEYGLYQFDAELKHLSHQPRLINQPASLELTTVQNQDVPQLFKLNAEIDYRIANAHKEFASIQLSNFPVKQWQIIKDSNLQVEIQRSVLNAKAKIQRASGNIQGQGQASFKQVVFNNAGYNRFTQEVAAAIAEVKGFDVDLKFSDDLSNLIVRSDLDDQISAAINSRLKQQQKALEEKLKLGINQELQRALNNTDLDVVLDQQASLDQQLNQVESLLKQEIDDFSQQQKAKQKDKAKQAVDKHKDKHKDKLKDKLKSLF